MTSTWGLRGFGLVAAVLGTAAVLSGSVAAAQANALTKGTSVSTNWSGYAIHRAHVKFRRISGAWIEPSGACTPGSDTYSAFWVGLGGYRLSSHALEQIGTELDCTASGRVKLSAWYELVPAPSRRIRMRLSPGDLMHAEVVVAGPKVRVTLTDRTRGESFTRTVSDRSTDVSSAEWIAEAPSDCLGVSRCQVLPLADFGSIGFTGASAETRGFHTGAIASSRWDRTRIVLGNAYGRRYVSSRSGSTLATPGGLTSGGRAFTILYTGPSGSSTASSSGSTGAVAAARPRSTGRRRLNAALR